jgi:hypothetical protein
VVLAVRGSGGRVERRISAGSVPRSRLGFGGVGDFSPLVVEEVHGGGDGWTGGR